MLHADDAGIVSKSAEGLAKMTTVIVNVFEATGLTVSEKKTGTMMLAGLTVSEKKRRQCCCAPSTRCSRSQRSSSKLRGPEVHADDAVCVPGRSHQCKWRHHARDQTTDPTRVGMLRPFQVRAVRYGGYPAHAKGAPAKDRGNGGPDARVCITWALGLEHFAKLPTALHNLLLKGPLSCSVDSATTTACPLKKAQCESVETTIRKRRLQFEEAVQRTSNERLTHRVMFGTMAGGVNPKRGRPEEDWA